MQIMIRHCEERSSRRSSLSHDWEMRLIRIALFIQYLESKRNARRIREDGVACDVQQSLT
jgi:hypothetical protein